MDESVQSPANDPSQGGDSKAGSPPTSNGVPTEGLDQRGVGSERPVGVRSTRRAESPTPKHVLRACQLNTEIQAVLAAMRQSSSKWGPHVPTPIDEASAEDPLLHDMKTLRRDVLTWTPQQWKSLPPITYLAPFLHVIASVKTNTVVTGVALSSLQKLLALNFFSADSYGAAEAIHQTVAAITSCHFEIADGASEESVLLRILQVLVACIKCDASVLLTDREVCLMVNTCFRVLNQPGPSGDVLQKAAAQALLDMVREIFARLPGMPAERAGAEVSGPDSAAGMLTPLASAGDEGEQQLTGSLSGKRILDALAGPTNHQGSFPDGQAERSPAAGRGAYSNESEVSEPTGRLPNEPIQSLTDGVNRASNSDTERTWGLDRGQILRPPAQPPASPPPSVLGFESGTQFSDADDLMASPRAVPGGTRPYGSDCMAEILLFLCALLDPDFIALQQQQQGRQSMAFLSFTERDEEETPLLPLSLVCAAVEQAGGAMAHHQKLLAVVKDNLFRALLYHGLSPNPAVLSQVLSIVYGLHQTLRRELKLQLESFLCCVLLRLALGPKHGATLGQQELALEALGDLCSHPAFAPETYANYDCEITCSNAFEETATLLSRTAIPVNSPLTNINVLALDAMLNVLSGLGRRVQPGEVLPPAQLPTDVDFPGDSFWTSKPESTEHPDRWIEFVQKKKFIKRRLLIGADHFNRDPKKGVQFLQGIGLFPAPLDAKSIACFFRYTPGLSKVFLGDYLGDHDPFKVCVLQEFVNLFDFRGMALDAALRTFLESFKLPGEAQKIARILEVFAEHFYVQCPGALANKDTAYILSYSLIMLNTDQHNGQVKRKMTEEEFIRNNRSINDGQDLPREMLSELYHSIAKNEIKITADSSVRSYHEMTYSAWIDLLRRSSRVTPHLDCPACPVLDREVFVLVASPAIAALSVVFDNTEDEVLLRKCAEGFASLAYLCASYGLGDLLDNLVTSICKFVSLLNPGALPEEPAVTFGEDLKARLAAVTVFSIANEHGNVIRGAWRNVLDCVLRLHKLGLLPGSVIADVEDLPGSASEDGSLPGADISRPSAGISRTGSGLPFSTLAITSPHIMGRKKQGGGLITRMSQLFLLDVEDAAAALPTQQQAAAQQKAVSTIVECRVGDMFSKSQTLQPASLQQLSSALVWAAGRPLRGGGVSSLEDEDTAVFCLDLLFVVTVANASRASLVWPVVFECVAAIVQSASGPNPLVERAVVGMLKVLQRVLPRAGEPASDELLRSLHIILSLDARAAEAYCGRITREVASLVCNEACLGTMRSASVWKSVCRLLAISSHHVDAWEPGFQALQFVMGNGGAHVVPANYSHCMDAARDFAESRAGGAEVSKKALDLLGGNVECLERWEQKLVEGEGAQSSPSPASVPEAPSATALEGGESRAPVPVHSSLADMWLRLAQVLRRICLDPREEVRTHAVIWLQRCLLAGETLGMPVTVWGPCFDQVVFVLVSDLVEASGRPKEYRGIEGTLLAAVRLLSKVFLHFLGQLSTLPGAGFRALWSGVLQHMDKVLKVARRVGSEHLQENVTEVMKNILAVMQSSGVLVNNPDNPESIWEPTWKAVKIMMSRFKTQDIQEMMQPPVAKPVLSEGKPLLS